MRGPGAREEGLFSVFSFRFSVRDQERLKQSWQRRPCRSGDLAANDVAPAPCPGMFAAGWPLLHPGSRARECPPPWQRRPCGSGDLAANNVAPVLCPGMFAAGWPLLHPRRKNRLPPWQRRPCGSGDLAANCVAPVPWEHSRPGGRSYGGADQPSAGSAQSHFKPQTAIGAPHARLAQTPRQACAQHMHGNPESSHVLAGPASGPAQCGLHPRHHAPTGADHGDHFR